MNKIQANLDALKIKIREELNPYIGRHRASKLKSTRFTIISNNCWAGHVYRYFNLPYDSPTLDYIFFQKII